VVAQVQSAFQKWKITTTCFLPSEQNLNSS